jgi:hypothetical protein
LCVAFVSLPPSFKSYFGITALRLAFGTYTKSDLSSVVLLKRNARRRARFQSIETLQFKVGEEKLIIEVLEKKAG